MVNVIAVPQGLEEPVGEAQHHDVLDRLFSEVVVDPIDLLLREPAVNILVEHLRARDIGAKGLLDDHAPPAVTVLAREPALAQMLDRRRKTARWNGEIEQGVSIGSASLLL